MPTNDFSIAIPLGRPGGLAGLALGQRLPWLAARIGINLARAWGRPFRFGRTLIAARYSDVSDALARDLDFRIQPVNAPHFDRIGYHFILGMDRSGELIAERRTLYTALTNVDARELQAAAAADIAARLDAAGCGPIDVVEAYARPVAAGTARRLFGIGSEEDSRFKDAVRTIFGYCFLNAASGTEIEDRALAAAALLTTSFDDEIARRRNRGTFGTDMMGALLAAGVRDDLTRRTLGGMLVGAIDTTATVVAKVISVLMQDRSLRKQANQDRGDLTRLYGWCQEALRRWPHGPALERIAAANTILGGASVAPGDTLILWTQAAMLDPDAFPDPLTLRPDRPSASYFHFGGGLHPCAGRALNAWQIPMLVAGLLERGPDRLGELRWAGPFPAHLELTFAGARS